MYVCVLLFVCIEREYSADSLLKVLSTSLICHLNYFTFTDPAIKAHVKRLLSPGQAICDGDVSTNNCSRIGVDKNSHNICGNNCDDKKKKICRKSNSPELPIGSPQAPIGASQYETRSNGTYSDASGSSEFEALLPPTDSFKEEERTQWEPLSGDKFNRQKNTPR